MTNFAAVDAASTDILAVANQPLLWLMALGVFLIIIVQTLIYVRAVRRVAPAVGVTPDELRTSFRLVRWPLWGPHWPWRSSRWPC